MGYASKQTPFSILCHGANGGAHEPIYPLSDTYIILSLAIKLRALCASGAFIFNGALI